MQVAVIDTTDVLVTPVFKIMEIENIPKSETAGFAVMEMHEVVEVRFAGSKNYAPIFPAHAQWKREGNQTITYAEHWGDQFRAFKEGNLQEAAGTPLQMLASYGVTPEQMALCRALKIYSIEALNALEHPQSKTLGMHANTLKDAATRFMADRYQGRDATAELEALRARVAELEAGALAIPPQASPEEIDAAEQAADDAWAGYSDTQLKDEIAKLNDGKRPPGNPSRATLVQSLETLMAA